MNTQGLLLLAQVVLPTDILTKFAIVKVESKGFTEPVTVRDFPIRDKGVDLIVRRRRWYDNQTNDTIRADNES